MKERCFERSGRLNDLLGESAAGPHLSRKVMRVHSPLNQLETILPLN